MYFKHINPSLKSFHNFPSPQPPYFNFFLQKPNKNSNSFCVKSCDCLLLLFVCFLICVFVERLHPFCWFLAYLREESNHRLRQESRG